MPNRILRDGIIDSKSINALSDEAEVFYRRLMSIVDDYGRFEADSELIRARCFPRQLERWSVDRVSRCLSECSVENRGSPLVSVYHVGTKNYLQINNFGQRVQSKPKFPGPDSPESTVIHGGKPLRATRAQSESESESYTKTESESLKPSPKNGSRKKHNTTIPYEVAPEEWIEYPISKFGWSRERALDTFDAMRLWALSKESVYADWNSAWQGWCQRDNKKPQSASLFNSNGNGTHKQTFEESVSQTLAERHRRGVKLL